MKTHTPSSLPLSALTILLALGVSTLVLHWLNLPVIIGLLGLPLVFYIAGREAEWLRQRRHELANFHLIQDEKAYDSHSEAEKAASKANRVLEELRKPWPGATLEDSTTTTATA